MRSDAPPAAISAVKEGIAKIRQAESALRKQTQQEQQDRADYTHFQRATHLHSRNPRDPQAVEHYVRDRAGEELWSLWFLGEAERKRELEHQLKLVVRDLVDRLYQVMDYFEEKFNPAENLLMLGSEDVVAVAESILSHRLPAHEPIREIAAEVNRTWLERSYRSLLAQATPVALS
jgi:hypothetical protein